jgi:IclR family pca regulon transcriptional regulator
MLEPDGSTYVQSLARGLAVIRAFGAERPRLSLSDVARATDLTRASARRFLLTLESEGYVRARDGMFELTPRVLELGFSYLSAQSLPEVAQPHLEALSHAVGESSSASILDGWDIVYIARVPTRRIMSVGITIGTRFPAYVTSMGRVLLAALSADELETFFEGFRGERFTARTVVDPDALRAELSQVAAQGWSLVDGELETGLRALAVPVTRGSATVAAINVSMPATDEDAGIQALRLLPAIQDAAAAISKDLSPVG